MIDTTRRSFIGLLGAGIAAPALLRSGIIMPVRPLLIDEGAIGLSTEVSDEAISDFGFLSPSARAAWAAEITKQGIFYARFFSSNQ